MPTRGLLWRFSEGLCLAHKTIFKHHISFLPKRRGTTLTPTFTTLYEVSWNQFYIITYCFTKELLYPADQLFNKKKGTNTKHL